MPFTRSQFFEVFARYNEATWPAQLILIALAIAAVVLAFHRSAAAGRLICAILAMLWMWMGVVYHAGFFAEVNPLARIFAILFVGQSFLFLRLATGRRSVRFSPRGNARSVMAAILIVFALPGYAVLSILAGHNYPGQPTFGLPCPTTIFTLGLLLLASSAIPRSVFAIPVAWAVVGSTGAFLLGVPEDLSLLMAALATAGMWVEGSLKRKAARYHAPLSF